jgi:hypothetical protein
MLCQSVVAVATQLAGGTDDQSAMLSLGMPLVSVLGVWERVPTAHAPTARTSGAMAALNGGGLLLCIAQGLKP